MTAVLLSKENIDFVKHELRQVWQGVPPTLRMELLAAALGFKTYAALLSQLSISCHRVASFGSPVELLRRCKELGLADVDPEQLKAILRNSSFPQRMWCGIKQGDQASSNAWFHDCNQANIPFIRVEMRRKYARLSWDRISMNSDYDTLYGAGLVDKMFRRFQLSCNGKAPKSFFDGSSFVGSIDCLPLDIARDLADDLFIMLTEPLRISAAA